MASREVKGINHGYKARYIKKRQKGHGTYAHGLPGTSSGTHLPSSTADKTRQCRCGGCNADK